MKIAEDIKRLREYRKASEADNCDCGCFQDDAIANVCDALENLDKTHTALIHKYTEVKEQLEVSLKDNDALSNSFYDCNKYAVELEDQVNRWKARAEKKGEQAEAGHLKLEKCIAVIKDHVDENPSKNYACMGDTGAARKLLKELGIE